MAFKHKHLLGGTFIVAGTAIGAGMLALPIVTGVGGFWPSFLVYALCWVFMTVTGLFLLELCLAMPNDSNIISIAGNYLGKWGEIAAWILYIFLFYTLSVAYISVGGELLSNLLHTPEWIGSLVFVAVFGFFVYLGAFMVDRINLILMAGLILSYLTFVVIGIDSVDLRLLKHSNFLASFFALPVIFTSFSYQGVIPSLTTYLKRDVSSLRKAIIFGTSFVFVTYIIWEFLILGIIPVEGAHGLGQALHLGQSAIDPLRYHVQSKVIYKIGQFFSFFSITTSFLGVSLGLFDFLADGLKISKKGTKKIFLWTITFLPTTLVAIINPHIFLIALGYAGGVGCALLLGFLPALMIWVARFRKKKKPLIKVIPVSRFFLLVLFAFVLFELIIQISKEFVPVLYSS